MKQSTNNISLRAILYQYFKENLTVLPADFYLAQYNMVRNFLMTISEEGILSKEEFPSHTLETPDRVYRYFFVETKPNGTKLVVNAIKKDSEGEIVNTYIETICKKDLRDFIVVKLDPLTTIVHNHKEFPSVSVEKWANFIEQLDRVDAFWKEYGIPNQWGDVLDFMVEKLENDWGHQFASHKMNQVYAEKDRINIINRILEFDYASIMFKYKKDSDTTFMLDISIIYTATKDGHRSENCGQYEERFGVPSEATQLLSILTRRSGRFVKECIVSTCV